MVRGEIRKKKFIKAPMRTIIKKNVEKHCPKAVEISRS
jgi:hypothetical protein